MLDRVEKVIYEKLS